jgi:hypothetical protein
VAVKIRQVLAQPLRLDGHNLNIQPSIGVAQYPSMALKKNSCSGTPMRRCTPPSASITCGSSESRSPFVVASPFF